MPNRLFSTALAALFLVLAATALGGCGSSAGAARSPQNDERASEPEERESASAGDDEPAEDDSEAAADEKPRSSCDDGTCFRCGKGLCLAGWYCDESAPGGAACSWLPECSGKSGCGCITRVLGSGCSCKDEDGARHVTCG